MFLFQKKQQDKILRKNPPRVKKRREEAPVRFSRIAFYFLFLVFLGVAAYVFFFSPFLEINTIAISGTKNLSRENIFNDIRSEYGGKYLKFIPKNNLILVSNKRIERNIADHFRKIKSVEIRKIFPDTLQVNIEERKSLILWCAGGPCYIVDERGYAYTGIGLDSPEVSQNNLIKLVDNSAQPVIMGEKILNEDYIIFLMNLREELSKTDVSINDEWNTPSLVAEEVEIKTQEGWRLYFSEKVIPDKALRTLKTFLEEEVPAEKKSQLEYVDLRVENRVYYKLREDETTQPEIKEVGGSNEEVEEKKDKPKKEEG